MPRAEEHLKHGVRSYNYYLGYVCMDVPDKQFTLTNTSSTNSFLSMDKKEQTWISHSSTYLSLYRV